MPTELVKRACDYRTVGSIEVIFETLDQRLAHLGFEKLAILITKDPNSIKNFYLSASGHWLSLDFTRRTASFFSGRLEVKLAYFRTDDCELEKKVFRAFGLQGLIKE